MAKPSISRLLGTPLSYLIERAGGFGYSRQGDIRRPMMGRALKSIDVPVLKGTSGILVLTKEQAVEEPILPCVKCGKCD